MQHHLSPFGSHISILGPYSQADYEIRPGRGRLTKERPRRRVNIGNILKKPRRGGEGVWDDKLTAQRGVSNMLDASRLSIMSCDIHSLLDRSLRLSSSGLKSKYYKKEIKPSKVGQQYLRHIDLWYLRLEKKQLLKHCIVDNKSNKFLTSSSPYISLVKLILLQQQFQF